MSKITYDEIIQRIGYFRTKAKLSLRETSLKLGYNPQFMKTIENKTVELKVKTLLDFCDIIGITLQEFFYFGDHFSKDDKELIDMLTNLSNDGKETIINLLKFKKS